MNNSYTRQSAFSNGDVIDATLFNAEYDQLELAFSNTTGHTHDGSAGQGSYIPLISDPSKATYAQVDISDPTNHKFQLYLDGVLALTVDQTSGMQPATIASNIQDLQNVNAPVADGFFRWNTAADTVEFSATIDAADTTGFHVVATSGAVTDLTGVSLVASTGEYGDLLNTPVLDSVNFTHNAQNMQTFLNGLDQRATDAAADAAAAAQSASEALTSANNAEQSAQDAQNAAMVLGVPVIVADAGSYTIPDAAVVADVVFEGDGTLNLPATLTVGRRYHVRLSFKASISKQVLIANPLYNIIGDVRTLVPGDNLTLSRGELVVLEVISATELEIL